MECYIRKNHMTIGEEEIWEVVSCANDNVIWFGGEKKLDKILGRSDWQPGDIIIWKK
jgi:hypothetical protein